MTWLEKYQLRSLRLSEAGFDTCNLYKRLKGKKGYLTTCEIAKYMESFDYYLSLRNEYDKMTDNLCEGIIRLQDQCEL